MGTTSFNFTGTRAEALKQVELETTNGMNVIAKAKSGNALFFAVLHNDNVFAYVVVCEFRKNEVFYKEMDEFTGPHHTAKCPDKIMKLLSPLDSFSSELGVMLSWAKAWRERQKPCVNPEGKIVIFEHGYKFADNHIVKEFYAKKVNGKMRFFVTPFSLVGFLLPNWKNNTFTVI